MKGKIKRIHSKSLLVSPAKPLRVCAYVRVSTEHSAQLQSLANQTDYYNNKFEDCSHCIFVGVFSDIGISGAKENRPGF